MKSERMIVKWLKLCGCDCQNEIGDETVYVFQQKVSHFITCCFVDDVKIFKIFKKLSRNPAFEIQ